MIFHAENAELIRKERKDKLFEPHRDIENIEARNEYKLKLTHSTFDYS